MLTADMTIQCWGRGKDGGLGTGNTVHAFAPSPAIELNTAGSANVQLVAEFYGTYVDIELTTFF
jgi:hypothetical protein